MLKIKMASIVLTLTAGFLVCAVDVTLWAWGGNGSFLASKTISGSSGFSLRNMKLSIGTGNVVGSQKATAQFSLQNSLPSVPSQTVPAQPVTPVITAVPVLSVSGAPVGSQVLTIGPQNGVTVKFKVDGYEQGKGYTLGCFGDIPDGLNMLTGINQNTGEIELVFKTNDNELADKEIIAAITPYLKDASGYVVSQAEPVNIGFEIKDFEVEQVKPIVLDIRGMPDEAQELTIGSEEGARIELTVTGYDKAKGYKLECYCSDNQDSLQMDKEIDLETGRIVLTFKTDDDGLVGKESRVLVTPVILDSAGKMVNYCINVGIDFVVKARFIQEERPVENNKSLEARCTLSEPLELKHNDISNPVRVDFIVNGLPEGSSKEDLTVSWDNGQYGDIGEKTVERQEDGSYKVTVPVVYGGIATGEQTVTGNLDFNGVKVPFSFKADISIEKNAQDSIATSTPKVAVDSNAPIESSGIKVLSEHIFIPGDKTEVAKVKLKVSGLIESDAGEDFHIQWDNGVKGVYDKSQITKMGDNTYAFEFSVRYMRNDGQDVCGKIILSSGQEFSFSAQAESADNSLGKGWVEGKKTGVIGMYGLITKNEVDALSSEEGITYLKVTLASDWADPDSSINPVGDYPSGSVFYIDQHMLRTGMEDGLFMNDYAAKVRLSDGTEAFGYMKASTGLLSHEKDLKTREEINSYAGVLPHWKESLELKQEFSSTSVQYPGDYGSGYFLMLLYGGLNPDTQDFINWQRDVYSDVDFKEQNELLFVKDLTMSIRAHGTYDKDLAWLQSFHNPVAKVLGGFATRLGVIFNSYANGLSITNKLANEESSCADFSVVENYMLGQQGIYSELYQSASHALLKIKYNQIDYAVDPTNKRVMPLADYEKNFGGSILDGEIGSLYKAK